MCQVFADDGYDIISTLLFGPNPYCDGYFKGIDLSHNNLTYVPINAYNP
ncbi:MAG: hypothetical protein HUJ68_08550 [Clostridia bacterium]|nr:hypothetical protein [Clostridia bacterium]